MLEVTNVTDTETEVMNTITEYEDRFTVSVKMSEDETMELLFVIGYRGDMKGDKLIASVQIDGSELWERFIIDEDSCEDNHLSMCEFLGDWTDRYFEGHTEEELQALYDKIVDVIEKHCEKQGIEID